jgi:16S rRNA (adenine1518-N6/adenine1519-N6)-dimethyltransferase
VLRIVPRPDPVVAPEEEGEFRAFVQGVFGLRRKQMRRVLRELWNISPEDAEKILVAATVDPSARPETLSPLDFARLLHASAR